MSDGTQLSAENSLQNVTQHVANEDPSTSMQTGVNPIPPPSLEVNKWIAVAESKTYTPDTFRRMNGSDIGLEWILSDENAMKEPIVVENSEGLGMKMPPKELTVRDIANEVGPDTPVEVIGVYHRYLYISTDDKHL
jgi:F-box/leucine-rich repeat protein 10/11